MPVLFLKKLFLKKLLHPVCILGEFLAFVGLLASSVLLAVDILGKETNPYRGIFAYMIFPGLMFLGFTLVGIGLFLEARRTRRLGLTEATWRPALNLSNRRHRRIFFSFAGVLIVFVLVSLLGGMRAYEFTESASFCGQTCHEPMSPQFTAYQDSPHAHVPCAECHVGPGVGNYVEAKLAGLRQVYKVLSGTFSRPIRADRDDLLPARETCEGCHWPAQFWGSKLDQRVRYGYDLSNTRRPIQILMKVGGGSNGGPRQGIHWHMSLQNRVHYRTPDSEHQEIPWVEVERPDGKKLVYRDPESKLPAAEIAKLPERVMDCLGCHNRPAHAFHTPDAALDRALDSGAIDATLPSIKKAAVLALAGPYASAEEAAAGLRSSVEGFYRERFGGVVLERRETLDRAIGSIQDIYRRNFFPGMKVNGYTHPDDIGHREFPGCFRCHSGRHRTEDGQLLDSRCDLCHHFMESQRGSASLSEVPADARHLHPWRGHDHEKIACWSCHTGSASPYERCAQCHQKALNGHSMQFECSICHQPRGAAVTGSACAPCHPVGASPLHVRQGHEDCLACHRQHEWKVDGAKGCGGASCHPKLKPDHYTGQACVPCHEFKGVLAQMKGLPASLPVAPVPPTSPGK